MAVDPILTPVAGLHIGVNQIENPPSNLPVSEAPKLL